MKQLVVVCFFLIGGCSAVPYKHLNLDTTSGFKVPEIGKAGIYVYQWKTGPFGAGFDVDFELTDYPPLSLNTGEYGYFEVHPGDYEYKFSGGLFDSYIPVSFEANENYFFRAYFSMGDYSLLIRSQNEIDEAKKNILTGRYEHHLID